MVYVLANTKDKLCWETRGLTDGYKLIINLRNLFDNVFENKSLESTPTWKADMVAKCTFTEELDRPESTKQSRYSEISNKGQDSDLPIYCPCSKTLPSGIIGPTSRWLMGRHQNISHYVWPLAYGKTNHIEM